MKKPISKQKTTVGKAHSSKKTSISLAIDEKILNEIKNEAKLDELSLNSKINGILAKYVTFYGHVERLGCVVLPPTIFTSFLEIMDREHIIEILIRDGHNATVSFFNHRNLKFTIENLIKYGFEGVYLWTGQYSFFSHYIDNEGYSNLVLEHKFGLKWSDILGAIHSDLIETFFHFPTKVNISPTTVSLRIQEKDITEIR